MADDSTRNESPSSGAGTPAHPEGWSAADEQIEQRLIVDEERLTHDEERLALDEQRLARDEQRLSKDELRLTEDERWLRRNWRMTLVLGGMLALTITALIISLIALNRDIEAVAKAQPKDNSVGTAAMKDGAVTDTKLAQRAVTAPKIAPQAIGTSALAPRAVGSSALAPRAVGSSALAPRAVGTRHIAPAAVTGAKVAKNTLTGANIAEGSLGQVTRASRADLAANASALGGITASRYVSNVSIVRRATSASTLEVKGPVTVTCPTGTTVIGGGAAIDGVTRGVAITTSTPDGTRAWMAEAAAVAVGQASTPWRLVVTAICAAGG